MARDYYDESKKKKEKKAVATKTPQSSVSKGSTFLGGGASVKKAEERSTTSSSSSSTSSSSSASRATERVQERSQKSTFMGGTETTPVRRKPAQTSSSRLTANTTAAQRQKMGMPTSEDIQNARESRRELRTRTSKAIKDATSEENKAFMQRLKSGTLTSADKQKIEQQSQRRTEVAKNTGRAGVKGAQDAITGYRKTMADLAEMTESTERATYGQAAKLGIDKSDREQWAKLEANRTKGYQQARDKRLALQKQQDERQAEWDERIKDATKFEKALYGAAESGTGMLVDTGIGALTGTGQFGALASMGLRSYGTARGQAEKEGATENEDRLYALAQAGKEVGTELMFQGAGLAKKAYGSTGLSLADRAANVLTKGLTGRKADIVGAGTRLLGGTAEENVEELAGWGLDPVIKELTYGKNVRQRTAETLRANLPEVTNQAEAEKVAAYFSTSEFTDDLTEEYKKSGMSDNEARELAAEMRDYYVAYYSGDQKRFEELEDDLSRKLSGQPGLSRKAWSMDELGETFAATTLLTMATGLPGAVTTSVKGNQAFGDPDSPLRQMFGDDAVKFVADAVRNVSDEELSLKASVMKERIDSGKDLTGTQKWDLLQGYQQKLNETAKKAQASNGTVNRARQEQDLVATMGVDANGNRVYAKETQREFNQKYAEAELTVEGIRQYLESDNSISDDESRRADAVKKAVADLHVGGMTVGDAHEFAYGNTLAREALKIEEGIDLDEYIVRDKKGNIDYAATNEATENALYAINADNAIRAAQNETRVYIDDTRGRIDSDILGRMGVNGQATWKEINKSVDPRNINEYLTTARASSYFYSAGRNTDMSVDDAIRQYSGGAFRNVDKAALKRAFAAGSRDRIIANTPGYGQTVSAGSNISLKNTAPIITGQFIMDDDIKESVPDTVQQAYIALAMSTNTNVHLVGDLSPVDKDGNAIINQRTGLPVQLNGMSKGNDIYINVNASAEQNLGYVFMHEMTHQLKQYAPNEYMALENLVRDRWFNKNHAQMQNAIQSRIDLYRTKGGQNLTEEEALEEIIADAMAEAMDDPDFAAQVCEEDINLGQAILNSIKAALRSIRQIFANGDFQNENFHNGLLSYLGILDEAEKMWINALATARQNKADGLIADWQDRANKQNDTRLSVTDEEVERIKAKKRTNAKDREILRDAGEKLKENDFYSLYTAHIINLGGKGVNAEQMVESIKENGFNGSGGFGVNLVDASINNISRQTEDEIREDFRQIGFSEEQIDNKINQLKEQTSGPNRWIDDTYYQGINFTVDKYGGRKGQTVMFVPEHHTTDDRSLIERGFKPFDYEVVQVERDFQPYYELYSKAYDEAHWLDNISESGTRFSINEPVERVKDLIAVHNLNEEDLVGNLGLGGFPMPSIAIIKDSMGHEKYGDISLLFNSSTIDPTVTSANQVFGGDAYTPTFPTVHYKANSKVSKKLVDMYYDNARTIGFDTMRPLYDYAVTIDDTLDRVGGEKGIIDRAKNDVSLKRLFLKLNDKDVEDVINRTETTLSDAQVKSLDAFIGSFGKDKIIDYYKGLKESAQFFAYRKEWIENNKDSLRKAYAAYLEESFAQEGLSTTEEEMNQILDSLKPKDYLSVVLDSKKYIDNGKTTYKEEKDYAATNKAVEEAAEANGYDAWVEDLFKGIEEKSGIRNNKDMYTASGNRRSWESLHEPVTLDNVVRQMKKELDAGGEGFFGNNPIGAAQKKYKNLDEIRADESRLQQLDDENYGKLREEATAKLSKVSHEIYENSPKRMDSHSFFGAIDVGSDIAEALNTSRKKDRLKAILEKDYLYNVSDENMNDLMDALNDLANLPTEYFEAKPKRAVRFDEVKAAIVPEGFADHLKTQLSNYGTKVYEYNPDTEGDRTEKVNKAASENDLRFSISAKYDDAYMDAVNSGDMDEAQRLVDEASKEAGFDTELYHGTTDFGFTQIKTSDLESKSDGGYYDWSPFFATDSLAVAQTYSSQDEIKRISQASAPLDEDQFYDDYNDAVNSLVEAINSFAEIYNYMDYTENPFMAAFDELVNTSHSASDITGELNDFVVGDIITEIAWDRANNYADSNPDEDIDVSEYADELQEGEESSAIWEKFNIVADLLRTYDESIYGNSSRGNYALRANTDNMMRIDAKRSKWNSIPASALTDITGEEQSMVDYVNTRTAASYARDHGYDGIQISNLFDDGGKGKRQKEPATVYIFFKPESQVRSADPVTYAEDGSVILLSERFDPTNNDIRYSMPTTDADGNVLTDGQMEYFKNSQARDEQGRLVPVYHTTNKGGFTIFDPMRSDDHRSLFFSSDWDVSQTYGENANDAIDLANAGFKTWESFEQYALENFADYPGWDSTKSVAENLKAEITPNKSKAIDTTFENWLNLSQRNKNYHVELKIPTESGSEYYMFADSQGELLRDISSILGKKFNQKGYYECYLNLENPMIIDAHGANWTSIPNGESFILPEHSILAQSAASMLKTADEIDRAYGIGQSLKKGDALREQAEKAGDGFKLTLGDKAVYVENDQEAIIEELADYFDVDMYGPAYNTLSHIAAAISNHFLLNPDTRTFFNHEQLLDFDVDLDRYNTRQWAEIAQEQGHDGVIFRNVVDIGEFGYGGGVSDVYVAFSSNQVKDTRNVNPTENPDIRYSITPDDEAKSQIAYDDAMDNSYELLAYYETQISNVNPETFDVNKAFKEEDVVSFLDALKAEDAVPSDDAKFEEDRVRRAKSKEDFFNNVNAKWNDRWITEGEVLKISSVKRDIMNLVKGAMANSNANVQYRNDIVRKTLIDARLAYQLMKQDRTELASYLLYHSSQRMIDGLEFIQDDTAFKEYKEIRDFLRQYRINAPEEYWENEKFQDFRKEYYGRLRIGKGKNNIEDVYSDLQSRWPHLFNESEREKAGLGDAVEDLLLHIGVVVDSNVTPFTEAYSSEEAASLAFELADQLYEIIANGDRVVSLADSYKEKFDAKTKAMKQRHYEAILRERKIREEGIRKEREKFRAYKERDKERQAHREYFDRIKDTHDTLVKRLESNTADKHIPEQYKKELAKLLGAFDLQTVGSKKRETRTGHVAKNTIRMAAIKEALKNIEDRSEMFHVNDAITDIMDELSSVEGKTLDALSAAELKKIDDLLKSLLHEFNRYEKVKIGAKNLQAADLADAQVSSALEHAKLFGPGNDYRGPKGWLDQIINLDEMTPAYLFRRIDPDNVGLGLMWKEIRRSQDRYIRNTEQINKWVDEIIGKYHNKGKFGKKYGADTIEQWRSSNYTQTFELTNGTVELTPAQMMSLYCLAKRNQAYGHMVGAGIVVAPVSFQAKIMSDLKKKINRSLPVILTDADIKTITTALTPEQVNVADQLQELMSTKMADLGNEASMNVIGIKLFNETDYFPIKSDKAALERDLTNEQFENAIRNFGFTKAVQPGARNAIMIEDIFDVVTEHCNNMNLYNSYSETLNDFMKVFNKHSIQEDGADYSVRQALAHAYSQKATTFIMEFIRDLNGNVSKGRTTGIETAMNDTLANAKKASVFANLRVLVQQPTAITRAFAVIDPKYLKGVKIEKGAMKEMFEHCPIALWKSWGYYDINMGKSIESVIMNEGKWLEDMATQAYGAADNVTWTAIWQMVKAEMKDKHPDIKEGTDEYWDMCNDRMSEIVDLTQVVDSPLHRSHAMRAKDVLHKTMTSFMAEPTLTFNMIRDGWTRAKEAWAKGDKAEAARIMGRTESVALLQAATVAAAAAVVDALRGKNKGGGDDDEDKSLWWINFVENMKDELKIWNKVYYVKDLASIAEGWDNANLALQGWKTLFDGFRQFDKKLFEGSKTPWWNIYYNLIGGIGYFFGIPGKTLMKDGRAIFELLGGELPESLVGEEKSDAVVSETSALQKVRVFKQSSTSSSAKSTSSLVKVDTKDKWYDYENNPITVKDGSALDKLLNHFGVNLTAAEKSAISEEQKQEKREKKAEEIGSKYADLYGDERDKKVWAAVTTYFKSEDENSKAFSDMVQDGDFGDINEMKRIYIAAGGGAEYFDSRVLSESKKALKKSIKFNQTNAEVEAQERIKNYMTSHGMTEDELSDIVYRSDTAKDMKVAFRLNDKELMMEALEPLVNAGLTYQDLQRLWDNRNRMQLSSYDGRYKDKLKSTGKFIWPTEGVITSHFGYRNAPTAGASSNHPAIDIGAAQGTAVVAADGGVVISAGANGGYGNSVGIKHDNGMITWYNHLYSWNVKEGDTVAQGQQIAQVGSTGISTGPHLDFKIMDTDGEPVDPEKYLEAR